MLLPDDAMASAAGLWNDSCHRHIVISYSNWLLVGELQLRRSGASSCTPPARANSTRAPFSLSSFDSADAAVGTLRVGLEGRRSCAHSQSMNAEMACGAWAPVASGLAHNYQVSSCMLAGMC